MLGPYKSALVAAPGGYCGATLLRLFYFSIAAAAIEKGSSGRGFLLRPFSTAAAAGGRNSCRTSQNFAAIGALLYNAFSALKSNEYCII